MTRTSPRRIAWAIAGLAAMATLAAACGAYGGGSSAPSAGASIAPPPASIAPGGGPVAIAVAKDATLGDILTGDGGRTLYIFTKDTAGTSACTGTCAANWPPLTVPDGSALPAGPGITGAVATIARDDGTRQVTIGGAPVYYFTGDTKAGDVNGQGQGGIWFAVTPSGAGAGTNGAAPSPGGYGGSKGDY